MEKCLSYGILKQQRQNLYHTALQMVITKVTLPLQPNDAVFVIFKDKAVKTSVTLPPAEEKQLTTVEGSWKINFQKDRGAPARSNI